MARQVIDLGTLGTVSGDTIRDAFDKCNDNFQELYGNVNQDLKTTASPAFAGLSINGSPSFYSKETGKTDWKVIVDTSDADFMKIYAYDEGEVAFQKMQFGGSSAENTGFVVKANGYCGVGKAPSEAMDVSGNVKASGYKSSDGSSGTTQTVEIDDPSGYLHTVTIKNGLITNWNKAAV